MNRARVNKYFVLRAFLFCSLFFCLGSLIDPAAEAKNQKKESAHLRDQAQAELQAVPQKTIGRKADGADSSTTSPSGAFSGPESAPMSAATIHPLVTLAPSSVAKRSVWLDGQLTSYVPQGLGQVADLSPYPLASAGARPMLILSLKYLPLTMGGPEQIGGYLLGGLARHSVNLHAPGGYDLSETSITTLRSEFGVAVVSPIASDSKLKYGLAGGFGRLDSVQSGTTSYANEALALYYGALSLHVYYQLSAGLALSAGFSRLEKVASSDDSLDIQNNNFLLGMSGSLN